MLKIRLMRIGAKKRPFYRVVAVDERNKRTGGYIELLGTYNPLTEPKDIKLDKVKLEAWLKKGAQKSDGLLRILGEAPQKPPRKPKKEKKAEEPKVEEQPSAEVAVEEVKAEEKPTEEPKATEETPAEVQPAEQAPVEEVKTEESKESEESKDERPA